MMLVFGLRFLSRLLQFVQCLPIAVFQSKFQYLHDGVILSLAV